MGATTRTAIEPSDQRKRRRAVRVQRLQDRARRGVEDLQERLRPWALWVLLAAVPASLVMQQASALLADAQSEGRAAFRMSALTYPHWPPWDGTVATDAFAAWYQNGLASGTLGSIQGWVLIHQALDFLLFAPALFLVLGFAAQWAAPRLSVGWTWGPAAAYLVTDWTETAYTFALALDYLEPNAAVGPLSAWLATPLAVLTSLKWLFLVASVAVIVVSLVTMDRPGRRAGFGLLWQIRVQVVAVGLLTVFVGLPLSGPLEQMPDVLRSANDEGILSWDFWLPTLAVGVLSLVLWTSGSLIVSTLRARREQPSAQPSPGPADDEPVPPMRGLLYAGLAALAVAAILFLGPRWGSPSAGVFAPGALLVALYLMDWLVLRFLSMGHKHAGEQLIPERMVLRERLDIDRLALLVRIVAVLPLGVAGLGAVRSYAPVVLTGGLNGVDRTFGYAVGWSALGAATFLAIPLGVAALGRVEDGLAPPGVPARHSPAWRVTVGAAVVLGLLAVGFALWPVGWGSMLHTHGTLTVWLATLTAVAGLVQQRSEEREAVRFVRALGLRRTPWFVLAFLLFALVSRFDGGTGYHAVRTIDTTPTTQSVPEALDTWYEAAAECSGRAGGRRPVLPLLLVAAPGGGARAAYWTTLVMNELEELDRCGGASLFAASGVSGGSVGLAVWTAADGDAMTAAGDLTGSKALSATTAALLYRDFPRAFLGLHPDGVDRAAVEEDAWVEDVPGMAENFLAPPAGDRWEPILLLNASDLATGCKVVFTRLNLADDRGMTPGCTTTPLTNSRGRVSSLAAGAVEASRYLAREADCSAPEGEPVAPGSVSIASAALASARFPYVSPTGRMLLCDPETGEILEQLYVGDGGYIENTGIHTLLGLWTDLQPLVEEKNEIANGPVIVPIAVVVDNHYRSLARSGPAGRRSELTAPAFADRRVLIGAGALEQQLAAAFSGPLPGRARESDMTMAPADALRWFVVAPTTRPQIAAPLGWSLSDAARESLESQLDPVLLDPVSECGPKRSDDPLCVLADWLRGVPPRILN